MRLEQIGLRGLLVSLLGLITMTDSYAAASIVMHEMTVAIDTVAPGGRSQPGGTDKLRVVYDSKDIDPRTKHVKLLNMQHFIGGKYSPEHADAVAMPMNDAWLDLSQQPYRLHYHAKVVHGDAIVIDASEVTGRLEVRLQSDNSIAVAGPYTIDPRPMSGPEAEAAAAPATTPIPASSKQP